MDEPSLGLAPVIVDEVFDVIGEINRARVSVLPVEQNVERALEIANRGYLLSEGRIRLQALRMSSRPATSCGGLSSG